MSGETEKEEVINNAGEIQISATEKEEVINKAGEIQISATEKEEVINKAGEIQISATEKEEVINKAGEIQISATEKEELINKAGEIQISATRESHVFMAKLSEKANRFDEMMDLMEKVAITDSADLSDDERDLFSAAYKKLLGEIWNSWKIISEIEQEENRFGNADHVAIVGHYRSAIEGEISSTCQRILRLINSYLVPSTSAADLLVDYLKMKGDCYRCLKELGERKEALESNLSLQKSESKDVDARELKVYMAKISKKAERFEDMLNFMKKVLATVDSKELSLEEHNLFSDAYRNLISVRLNSWRIITDFEQEEERSGNKDDLAIIHHYKSTLEAEISGICHGIINILDSHFVSSASMVFRLKMKGECYRNLAEIESTLSSAQKFEELQDNPLLMMAKSRRASITQCMAEGRPFVGQPKCQKIPVSYEGSLGDFHTLRINMNEFIDLKEFENYLVSEIGLKLDNVCMLFSVSVDDPVKLKEKYPNREVEVVNFSAYQEGDTSNKCFMLDTAVDWNVVQNCAKGITVLMNTEVEEEANEE